MRGAMLLLTTSIPQLHHQVRTTIVRICAPGLNACLLSCMVSPSLLCADIAHARVLAGIWTASSIAIFLIGFGKSEMNMNTKIRLYPKNFLLCLLVALKGWCVWVYRLWYECELDWLAINSQRMQKWEGKGVYYREISYLTHTPHTHDVSQEWNFWGIEQGEAGRTGTIVLCPQAPYSQKYFI